MIYDRVATIYDRLMTPLERRFLSSWRKEALALLPTNANILELGAGTGANFPFYPPSKCAIASEISIEMLAKSGSKRQSKPIRLVQASCEDLPFPESSFDAAFATLVFCSIKNPEKAFAELSRVLKAGGKIVLLEHVRPSGILGYLFDVLSLITVALFEDHFNRNTRKIAEGTGLSVIAVRQKAFGIVNLIVCESSFKR